MITKRQHAVIAGTGRAGTSFLVKFLDACGLETDANAAPWFPRARAGLEHRLDPNQSLPYVVKDPWLFSYCEKLDLGMLQIDALILPMRGLMSAAESRVHQERMAPGDGWVGDESSVQLIANTPGGILYSLDVVDQARILGVGFYNLLHWAVVNELPVFLLSFPRMVEDPDYLLRVLWPWLRNHCTSEVAQKAFADTAAAGAVRIRPHPLAAGHTMVLGPGEPDPAVLHHAALNERIQELTNEHVTLSDQISHLTDAISRAKEHDAGQRETEALLEHRAAQAERERDELAWTISVQQEKLQRHRREAGDVAAKLERAEQDLASLRESSVWRLHQRMMRRRWLYRPARRVVRLLAR